MVPRLDITERHCMNYMIYCLYDECDTVGVDTVKVEAYNFFFFQKIENKFCLN